MKTFFVEQSKKVLLFHNIEINRNKIIVNKKMQNYKVEKKAKIARKIKGILINENCRQIVVKENLKKDKEFINLLYGLNINICSPKWLFKMCTKEVVEKILKDNKKEESEIFICVNDVDELIEKFIYIFAKEFKRLCIVTNHIGKFKKIEEKLYQEEGILITITNNKRKSLSKAELILNVDFPKEILNQFAIYDKATIVTWEDDIKILKKKFNGKIIRDCKIEFDKQSDIYEFVKTNELEGYDIMDICQAIQKIPKGIISI